MRACNSHSNQLVKGAIKAAKRMLRDNTEAQSILNANKFLAALLAHRNKADPKIIMSSSNMIFGRRIMDLMPIKPGQLKVVSRWAKLLKQREAVIAKRHMARGQALNKHTR